MLLYRHRLAESRKNREDNAKLRRKIDRPMPRRCGGARIARSMTQKPENSGIAVSGSLWATLAEGGVIVAVCLLLAGDPAPMVNEPHYLCRAKQFWDASYCPGDLFLESPDAHVTFVYGIGWLTKLFALPTVAWVGRIISWSLLAASWIWLVRAVVPRLGYAALSAAIWLTLADEYHLAGEWVVGGFEAKCLAYPLVIFGLGCAVRGWWNLAWIGLGGATAWHALVGAWSLIALAVVWLLHRPTWGALVRMTPGMGLGAMLALVGVLPALWLNAGVPPQVAADAAEVYVFERLAHHLAPLSKSPDWVAERVGKNVRVVALFLVASIFVVSRGAHSPPLRRLVHVLNFAAATLLLAFIGLGIEALLAGNREAAASLLRYYWLRLADVVVPMAVALAAVAGLASLFRTRANLATFALFALLSLVGWHLYDPVMQRINNPLPPADARTADLGAWIDVCDWVAAQTPPDALVLTPRGNSTFKWYASRAEVVTHKDVPQDAGSLLEWHRRLSDVYRFGGRNDQPYCQSTGQLGTPRVRQLAAEYGFDYVVTTVDFPLALDVVYANSVYVVYQTPGNL
jgi:ABC-type amino acid transport system permease subunit